MGAQRPAHAGGRPDGAARLRAGLRQLDRAEALRRDAGDYERLWSYLEDAVILDNYDQYYRDCAELGDDGIPKTEIERTPWQQLWIEWVGLEPLSYHLADWPEHVEHTLDLLERRARQTFEIAARSPAPFIVMVDNITASAIGPARFRKYCASPVR